MGLIRVIGSLADLDVPAEVISATTNVDVNVAKEGFYINSSSGRGRINVSPVSEICVRFTAVLSTVTNHATTQSWVSFFDTSFSTTQALFRLIQSNRADIDGNVIAQYWNGSTWVSIGTGPLAASSTLEESIHIKIADSGGIFRRKRNTATDGELLGDTKFTSATAIDRIEFRTTDSPVIRFSEIIIADEDCAGWRLQRLEPTGNGASTAWTGAYTDVDETGITDTDYISSATANQVETYNAADIHASLTGYNVKALVVAGRARKGGTGPQNLQAAVRVGSTDYFSSNISGLNVAFAPVQAVFEVNPATSAAWTQAEVNAAEIGLKSIA